MCVHGSFGRRKLILGPDKHEAVPLHLRLNPVRFISVFVRNGQYQTG